ncbi:MAG TPA: mycofactocin biosynthesis peptidyl-dipeptidase MftE [Solirubrobacterales bacterium]|nr:mycofactocin biosynthesis peptidyl-dipeptidase MftE [Solirubrobacterales bacterium]
MTRSRLDSATWPELDADTSAGPAVLVVPLGATEQHGPHLPLGTDTAIAVALAETAADLPWVRVAPPLAYGSSGEHQAFAGTLSIGAAATELVLVELGRSATETFAAVLFLSAHGGNAAPLAAAVARLRDEGRDVRAWAPRFGGDLHAGRTETSLMLALAPGSVRAGRDPGNRAALPDLIDDLRVGGVRPLAPNGVLGDPTDASKEEGGELFASAADDLRARMESWWGPGAAG